MKTILLFLILEDKLVYIHALVTVKLAMMKTFWVTTDLTVLTFQLKIETKLCAYTQMNNVKLLLSIMNGNLVKKTNMV